MSSDEMKKKAALAALAYLPESGVVGLGTGSTTRWFIEGVGELARAGRQLVGVPTSAASRTLAEQCGIPLLEDAGPWQIDVCVDGADEVSRSLDLIKGGGGAHTREKIVNYATKKNIIIVDESKLVELLGQTRKLPLEVLPFGLQTTFSALRAWGEPELRSQLGSQTQASRDAGAPFRTDSGNFIVDLATGPIASPAQLDQALHALPGVVDTGLFVGRADVVLVAGKAGVKELLRPT
jgi:ribose 5-phosphate isomerase A